MHFSELLRVKDIDPKSVLVLRHCPLEPELNKVLPWLATMELDVFNAYQQTQPVKVEKEIQAAKYVAAFIGQTPGKATFVGLFSFTGAKPITSQDYWQIPANQELKKFGLQGFTQESKRSTMLWLELELTEFYADWKGKLIVKWPPLDRNWHRWAHKPNNAMPVHAVLEESALEGVAKKWDEIELTWQDLRVLPPRLRSRLAEWRGIYLIFDTKDGKGYVGSAYGDENLLGRWLNYAAKGHGGNRLLRERDPSTFRFTILQLDAPNKEPRDVISLEGSWKKRLHTRQPFGLNEN